MNPTPEQVAQWAREAGDKDSEDPWQVSIWMLNTEELQRLVTRAMAEQAELDMKHADASYTEHDYSSYAEGWNDGVDAYQEVIRANAPKVTT